MELRQALVRRLATITLEKRRLHSRLLLLEELEKELRNLMEGAEQPTFPDVQEPREARLSELVDEAHQGAALKLFLQEQLGQGPKSLEELVVAVGNGRFDFGEKSIARTLHFHLLNLKHSGLIEKHEDRWKLVERTGTLKRVELTEGLKRKDSE